MDDMDDMDDMDMDHNTIHGPRHTLLSFHRCDMSDKPCSTPGMISENGGTYP